MEGCIGLDTDEFIADLKGWVYVWDNYFGLEGHSKVVDWHSYNLLGRVSEHIVEQVKLTVDE